MVECKNWLKFFVYNITCTNSKSMYTREQKNGPTLLTLLLVCSLYDDLVFSVFPSKFFPPSYKINLPKNGFVTLFLI